MDRNPRRVIGMVIGALIILLLGVLLIQAIIAPSDFWNNDASQPHFAWMILGFIFVLFVIGFIFRVIFWAFIGYGRSPGYAGYRRYDRWNWEYRSGPEHILHVRYAKGEITREQYQQMLEDIRKGKQGGTM